MIIVEGRWSGVRGRRFVRPTLVLVDEAGAENATLADLEGKPWAAEEGEPWHASFAVRGSVESATTIELTVAPDITVLLRGAAQPPAAPRRRLRPESLRRPPAGGERLAAPFEPDVELPTVMEAVSAATPARRPAARGHDAERLATRVSALESALEREQARRGEAERALDRARSDNRRIEAELARVRAELELARTGEREGTEAASTLERARRELDDLHRRLDALAAEHERTLRARAALEAEHRERSGELTAARDALASARGEIEATRETVLRERAAHADDLREATERGEAVGRDEADGRDEASRTLVTNRGERDRDREASQRSREQLHFPPPSRSERPLNPQLRGGNWAARFLVVLVLAAFLLAVYLVLHSTVLH